MKIKIITNSKVNIEDLKNQFIDDIKKIYKIKNDDIIETDICQFNYSKPNEINNFKNNFIDDADIYGVTHINHPDMYDLFKIISANKKDMIDITIRGGEYRGFDKIIKMTPVDKNDDIYKKYNTNFVLYDIDYIELQPSIESIRRYEKRGIDWINNPKLKHFDAKCRMEEAIKNIPRTKEILKKNKNV